MLSPPNAPAKDRRAYVVIDGLTFDEGPGVLYNVYLQGAGDARRQIGVFSFFGLSAPGGNRHASHSDSSRQFVFDSTDALKELTPAGEDQSLQLVIEPTTGLTDSSPELASEAINPKANVRFDGAKIVVGE
jgi:hypothetical protein